MLFFVSNCLSNLINYIWLNIIFKGSRVIVCFEEQCISNILLDVLFCALRTEAKYFVPLTEIMPFKFEYWSYLSTKLDLSFSAIFTALDHSKLYYALYDKFFYCW